MCPWNLSLAVTHTYMSAVMIFDVSRCNMESHSPWQAVPPYSAHQHLWQSSSTLMLPNVDHNSYRQMNCDLTLSAQTLLTSQPHQANKIWANYIKKCKNEIRAVSHQRMWNRSQSCTWRDVEFCSRSVWRSLKRSGCTLFTTAFSSFLSDVFIQASYH